MLNSLSPGRRTAAGIIAGGLAALALSAPAADAAPELYGVEVDAIVETTYSGHENTPTFEHDASVALSTHVTAGFLAVIDRAEGGRIVGATGEDQHTATTSGTITTREREYSADWDDWYERGTDCTGGGQNKNDEGRTSLSPDPLTPLVGASLVLNLADRLLVSADCTDTGRDGGAGPRSFALSSPLPEDPFSGGYGPLAVRFDLPAEATAAGKVIQLFEGPAEGHAAYCPEELAERAHKQACKVTFRGTITLTKTTTAPPPLPPVVPPVPGDVPIVRPTRPAADPAAERKPLLPRQQARLGAGASRLSFRAGCSGGCDGTASIRIAGRPRTVATIRLRVPRGASARTVQVTIPKSARRTLRRARGAVVVVALKDRASRRTSKVTLKLAVAS